MSPTARLRRPLARTLAVAATATVLLTTAFATGASAHGSQTYPPSRNYRCFEVWGNNHMAPEMATEDRMCYQAWQANPDSMWNHNGLYRENVRGAHQAVIPDGTLCSGGLTQNGRYRAMDAVGDWIATDVPTRFTLRIDDQASHGADYIRVYVTRPGYDPTSQPLRWADLELLTESPRIAPATVYQVPVDASGHSGRAILYTIWQASHLDQPYYFCSDVNFVS